MGVITQLQHQAILNLVLHISMDQGGGWLISRQENCNTQVNQKGALDPDTRSGSVASAASPDYVKFQAVIKSAASAASLRGGRASGRLDHGSCLCNIWPR